jgi:O-antigen/teichoic acid export membrane protein
VSGRGAQGTGAAEGRASRPNSSPGFVRRLFAESLFRNASFLIINLGVGAVSGYGGQALLTHVFSTADVGLSGAAVSAAALIETITLLGVSFSLPRYLPTAKNRRAMINTLFTSVISLTLVAAVIFLALPDSRKYIEGLGGTLFIVAFTVALCVQVGTTLVSTVLIADRASDKTATLGMIPAAIRVVAPLALSFLGSLGSFVARVIPDSFAFVLFAGSLVRGGHRFRPEFDMEVVRELGSFSVGMYIANIVGGLPQMLLPVIAISRVGNTQSAYWLTATSIASILYLLPSSVTSALLPEAAIRPNERGHLLRRSMLMIVGLVTPALIIAYLGAPLALAPFGHGIPQGSLPVLRILILSGSITMLNAVSGAVMFVAKKSTQITIVNTVNAVIVLGLALVWATSAKDISIAWLIGDIANTVLFAGFAVLAVMEVGGRLSELGGDVVLTPEEVATTGPQAALDLLFTMAEQQGGAGMYGGYNMYRSPYPAALTTSRGLYSLAAFQVAERQRLSRTSPQLGAITSAKTSARGAALRQAGQASGGRDDTHQALDVLFTMAQQQREGGGAEPGQYPPDGAAARPRRDPPRYRNPRGPRNDR